MHFLEAERASSIGGRRKVSSRPSGEIVVFGPGKRGRYRHAGTTHRPPNHIGDVTYDRMAVRHRHVTQVERRARNELAPARDELAETRADDDDVPDAGPSLDREAPVGGSN